MALDGRKPADDSKSTDPFDWGKTWVADMLLTDDERRRRRAAADLADAETGISEVKRLRELKSGVISCFSGIGLSVFLFFLMNAIANLVSVRNPEAADILRHIWLVGIMPFAVGLGLVVNALLIKASLLRTSDAALRRLTTGATDTTLDAGSQTGRLNVLGPAPHIASVTEHTTDLLKDPASIGRSESNHQS